MQEIVKARHMKLTPSLKDYAEVKLANALRRVIDRPAVKLDIELSKLGHVANGSDKECRIVVKMPWGRPIIIDEQADDMYKAINLAHDRMMRQIIREKRKSRDSARQRKQAVRLRNEIAASSFTVAPEPWEREVHEYEITNLV